jgi:C1A family cysteine protease
MAATITAGELRQALQKNNAKWTIDKTLKDTDPIRVYPTGGDLTQAVKAVNVPRVDISPYMTAVTSNPFLLQLRINRGLIQLKNLPTELQPITINAPIAKEPIEPFKPLASAVESTISPVKIPVVPVKTPIVNAPGAGTSASVDWRNRFGWPWLTKIKDQGPCESCWVFSAVGVVESMTRIEHAIWSLRSEGDVHDGLGAQCATTGWPTTAFNWMKSNGVADPGCWPYESQNLPYKPTADRDGRTVKLSDYVTLSNIDDQKNWIDTVGPLSACFTVYNDFFGYGANSGVYTANTSTGVAGGHCIVIVGYDDSKQAWLIRNSWNTGWGMAGYCWFGYGQADIDDNAKFGVPGANVNPDPWTKRRAHNGSLYESGDGQLNRNFELWTQAPGNAVRHYWRDGVSLQWNVAETQGNDCAASPSVQGTTYNRNFEFIYRTTGNQLHHRYFDQSSGQWGDGGVFGPQNVEGSPGFIQSDYNAPGNFETTFLVAGQTLQHYWRNDAGGNVWVAGPVFGSNVAGSGAALVQRFDNGLDVICRTSSGTMQRYWRNDPVAMTWQACESFGSGITSPPVMIEGQYGMSDETEPGNYELCVAVNGVIQHWYTASPTNASAPWTMSASFGQNVQQVLGLIQSSFGFNLELVALLKDGTLQHFWRSAADLGWRPGPIFGSTVK